MTVQELYMKPAQKKYTVQLGFKKYVLNTNSNEADNFAFSMQDEQGNGGIFVFGRLEEVQV